jgi:hypothetical protein
MKVLYAGVDISKALPESLIWQLSHLNMHQVQKIKTGIPLSIDNYPVVLITEYLQEKLLLCLLEVVSTLRILDVSSAEEVCTNTSSKGNQQKWACGKLFVKLNSVGYESTAESVTSNLLDYTEVNHVSYKQCLIKAHAEYLGLGCISSNFLSDGESDISFYRLLRSYKKDCLKYSYDDIREELYPIIGFDIKPYLDHVLCSDAIVRNEDRHFNNMSVIRSRDGYRVAPLYDFGQACLADTFMYPESMPIQELVHVVKAKPFKTDFYAQLKNVSPIEIRYSDYIRELAPVSETEKRAVEVILQGLKDFKDIAWVEV